MAHHTGKFWFVQGLTFVRVPLIGLWLVGSVLAPHPPGAMLFSLAFAAMILSAVTDLFDGYFARRFKVTTRLGAYADPLTDKIFYLTAFPTLIYLAGVNGQDTHAQVLLALAVLFLLRDQWVSFLRSVGAIYGVSAKANWSGKARTVISFPVICAIYYYLEAPKSWALTLPTWLIYTAEGVSIAINGISIWVYSRAYWPCIRREMSEENDQERKGS